jgi:membrane protease YdiL (CAAX protease family)
MLLWYLIQKERDTPSICFLREAEARNYYRGKNGKTGEKRNHLVLLSGDVKTSLTFLRDTGLCFVILLIIAFTLGFFASFADGKKTEAIAAAPESAAGLVVLFLFCLSTAYLEESYFRFYLLEKFASLGMNTIIAVTVSALSFAFLHSWEGFWGIFNALFAALFLSFIYLKTRNLHVIALSHAAYNIFVYMSS